MTTTKKTNREMVLAVLSKSGKPMTAYQILEKLRRYGVSGPPTVYRALHLLQASGEVHRIESMNAFVACHQHEHKPHPSSFIVCDDCGELEEIQDNRMEAILKEWGEKLGFFVVRQTIELLGLCLQCHQKTKERSL